MDVTDKDQYQWSDWFSKAKPAPAADDAPPAAEEAPPATGYEAGAEQVPVGNEAEPGEAEPAVGDAEPGEAVGEAEPEAAVAVAEPAPDEVDAGYVPAETSAQPVAAEMATGPVDIGPVDTGPVDTGPVDIGPVGGEPIDAGDEPPDAETETGPVRTESGADLTGTEPVTAVPGPAPVWTDPHPTRPQPIIPRAEPAVSLSDELPDPQPTRAEPAVSLSDEFPDPQPTRAEPAPVWSDPQPTRPQPVVSRQVPPVTRPQPRVPRSEPQPVWTDPQPTRPQPIIPRAEPAVSLSDESPDPPHSRAEPVWMDPQPTRAEPVVSLSDELPDPPHSRAEPVWADPQPTRAEPVVSLWDPLPDPQPTRPQPVVSPQVPPVTRPQPRVPRSEPEPVQQIPPLPWPEPAGTRPEPQVTPAERGRPAGALPWILPTGGDVTPAADATTVQPAVPAEEKTPPPEAPALHQEMAGPGTAVPETAAPEEDSPPAAAPNVGRTGFSATYKRPELVSAADTVMLPKLKPGQGAPDQRVATKKKTASARTSAPETDRPRTDDEPTTIMPVQTMPRRVAAPVLPEEPYRPPQRRKWISRGVLLAILMMQAVLSLRLRNTAFEDEAQYLYAGRLEIAHLLHGTPLPINFASYFSGSPVLYPVLGAAANNVGGLAAARAVSLLEMLATTALLYAISRRLFNERVAICAALLYSVTAAVTFLGNFATFDASCLFLLAVAAWIMVRTAVSRWPLFLLAAPVAALAVATKYAGLLFVPTIAVLPVLTAWPYHRRRVFAYPVIFGVAVAALLYGAVKWGGHSYIQALQQTTTSRAQGSTPLSQILWETMKWGGIQFGAAVVGTIAYAWRPRTDEDEDISPAGSRLRRILLGLVLTGTALLAPAYQAHLHTDVSFHKHIGFGLFFAAPMAGAGLARVVGDHFRRPQLGIAVWGAAILMGMTQSAILFGGWGNSVGLVKVIARQIKPGARYLVELPEVPTYYLQGRPGALATQFYSTFVIFYVDPQGQTLTGDAGFEVAIKNGYFQVIAYEGTITPAVDNILASELKKSSLYRLASVVPDNTAYHTGSYYVWVKKTTSTAGAGKVTSKAGT